MSPAGFEPAFARLGGGRLIHWATAPFARFSLLPLFHFALLHSTSLRFSSLLLSPFSLHSYSSEILLPANAYPDLGLHHSARERRMRQTRHIPQTKSPSSGDVPIEQHCGHSPPSHEQYPHCFVSDGTTQRVQPILCHPAPSAQHPAPSAQYSTRCPACITQNPQGKPAVHR